MMRIVTRAVLAGSGALLGVIGGALMVSPISFLEMSHVNVERDPGLMSELIAPSGLLLIASAFMILGAAQLRFANRGLVIGAIIYGGYGAGRLVSMALHGMPAKPLIAAMIIEFVMAALLMILRCFGRLTAGGRGSLKPLLEGA